MQTRSVPSVMANAGESLLNEFSRLCAGVECDTVIYENFRKRRGEIEQGIEGSRRPRPDTMRLVAVHHDNAVMPSVLRNDGIGLV